jgi:hypothetical protein
MHRTRAKIPPVSPYNIYSMVPRPLQSSCLPPSRSGLAGLRPSNAPRASGWMADTSRLASCTPNVRHSSFAPSPPPGEDDDDDDDDDVGGGVVLPRRRRRSAERAIIVETATAAVRVQMITTDDLVDDMMMVMSVSRDCLSV